MKFDFAPVNGSIDIPDLEAAQARLIRAKNEFDKLPYTEETKARLKAAADIFLTPIDEETPDIFFLLSDFKRVMKGYPSTNLTGANDEWSEPDDHGWRYNLRCERVRKSPKGLCYDIGTKLVSDDGAFSNAVFYEEGDYGKPISFPYMPGKSEFIHILRDSEENGQKTEKGYRVLDESKDEKLIVSLWETANEQFSKVEKEHPDLSWEELIDIYRKKRQSTLV